jgi:hypothetical protein
MSGQRPKKQFRMGRVVASIFDQTGQNGTLYNVSIVRLYKVNESDAEWQRSTSFNRDDLPLVSKVADLAWVWVYNQQQAERAAARETESELDA